MQILLKEIDLIQDCIKRMAQNSFMVKGWLITIIAVVLGLLPSSFDIKGLCIVGFVTMLCFWYLDAFFLKMEKLYRWKYEWVIVKRAETTEHSFDLNPHNNKMWLVGEKGNLKKEPYIIRVMGTYSLIPIYLILSVIIIFLFINSYICIL